MVIEGRELEGSNWNVTSHLAAEGDERVQNYVVAWISEKKYERNCIDRLYLVDQI